MEARGALAPRRAPSWLLGLLPLALVAAAAAALAILGVPGLGDRRGPPAEELSVERTELRPGVIELSVRNDGPDPVRVAQVVVNDAFADFDQKERKLGRLGANRIAISYPWVDGEGYEISLLTSTGATVEHAIEAAVETPKADIGFYGLMALLGLYVGIIPVAIGMLWLPFVRRIAEGWLRVLMALTVGLLGFLALDATLEGLDIATGAPQAFGGAGLVFLGAAASYVALSGVDAWVRSRASTPGSAYVPLLVAIGIGLHNLGEGLAIGSAYAVGALALGAFLVIGFALHNTTEGLAIVAPVAHDPPPLRRLVALGLIAGAPAVLGAWIGASAFNASLAAFLLGIGAGAIVAVIGQILPAVRDSAGRVFHPAGAAGIIGGMALLYATSLLVSV